MRARRLLAGPLAAAALAALAPQAGAAAPPIGAPSAIVIDAHTGDLLYGRRETDRRAIASTTKLMTAMVTLSRTDPG
jgi:D-alanyl-D-alanine carboxypeptidase